MIKKLKILLVIVQICLPYYTSAQPKPKRDISKDKSVVHAKTQERVKAIVANQFNEQTKKRTTDTSYPKILKKKTGYKSPPLPEKKLDTPKLASYLHVNQKDSLDIFLDPYDCSATFSVDTDGKNWYVANIPIWCKITKCSDSFVLLCEKNNSHDDRCYCIKVCCDDHEVPISVVQKGLPLDVSSRFNYAYLLHNVSGNICGLYGLQCLKIQTNLSIKGGKGQRFLVVAFLSDENNNAIKAASGFPYYALKMTNDLFVATEVLPTSDDSQSFEVSLFIPNNAMLLKNKKNKLRCQLAVYCVKNSSYISGANRTLSFKAKSKKNRVTTKSL